MWLARLFCAVDRHVPDRHRVRWDGFAYVGQCTRCDAPIRRLRKHRWTASFHNQPFHQPAPHTADAQP